MAHFEWLDETSLRHPSLVCVAENDQEQGLLVKEMPILWTRQIWDFSEVFTNKGNLDKRRLPRINGYHPQATQRLMESGDEGWYALVVVYVPVDPDSSDG